MDYLLSTPSVADVHLPGALKVLQGKKKKEFSVGRDDDKKLEESTDDSIALIFSGPNDPKLPTNIKKLGAKFRRMFVNVWNRVFARSKGKPEDRERQAFTQANGVVKKRIAATEFALQDIRMKTEVRVRTGEANGHTHVAVITKKDGSGKTDDKPGHSHTIANFKVKSEGGHTHSLPTSLHLVDFVLVTEGWKDQFDTDDSIGYPFTFADFPEVISELTELVDESESFHLVVQDELHELLEALISLESFDVPDGELVLDEVEDDTMPGSEVEIDGSQLVLNELEIYAPPGEDFFRSVIPLKEVLELADIDDTAKIIARNVQLLMTGKWFHEEYGKFEVTSKHLKEMESNFKGGSREVIFDYGHGSRLEGKASPDVTLRSGTILDVRIDGGRLLADVAFTKKASKFIKDGEFKFVSPEFAFYHKNRSTGKNQGATLRAAALTNRPFLEGMPAIALTRTDDGGPNVSKVHEVLGMTQEEFDALTPEQVIEKMGEALTVKSEGLAEEETKSDAEETKAEETSTETTSEDTASNTEAENTEETEKEETSTETVAVTEQIHQLTETVAELRKDNVELAGKVGTLTKTNWTMSMNERLDKLQEKGMLGGGDVAKQNRTFAISLAEKDMSLYEQWEKNLSPVAQLTEAGSSNTTMPSDVDTGDFDAALEIMTVMALKELGYTDLQINKEEGDNFEADKMDCQDRVLAKYPDMARRYRSIMLGESQ